MEEDVVAVAAGVAAYPARAGHLAWVVVAFLGRVAWVVAAAVHRVAVDAAGRSRDEILDAAVDPMAALHLVEMADARARPAGEAAEA